MGRLRATPGVPEGRVAEAERDQARGATRVEAEREAYEAIVKRLAEELAAFQRARAGELRAALARFAEIYAAGREREGRAWVRAAA